VSGFNAETVHDLDFVATVLTRSSTGIFLVGFA
jgi:hypothetical protein